jgi:chaperonin GroES
MQPIRNFILCKPFPPDEISDGGIIVPDSVKKDSNRLLVVATGRGTKDRKMQFTAGQTVYRVKDWGEPIDIEGERHYLMDQAAVLATE